MSAKTDKIDRLAELTARRHDDTGVGHSLWSDAFQRLRHSPMAIAGAIIIAIFVVLAIIGPFVAPHDPESLTWGDEVSPARGDFVGPRPENLLGLDNLGRDEFSRLLIGARQSLMVGVIATGLGFTIGAIVGSIAGASYGLGGRVGRRIDTVIMRLVDIMLALPSLLLALSIAAVLQPSLTSVMIAVGTIQIPIYARLLRGSMIAQSSGDYVLAAGALGVRKRRIALSHILPNSLGPVIVQATLSLATAIIEAAALAFLGLGNPDMSTPEWGVMLSQAQNFLGDAPQLAIYPAVAIIITALGFTLLGEAMREALDPKLRK